MPSDPDRRTRLVISGCLWTLIVGLALVAGFLLLLSVALPSGLGRSPEPAKTPTGPTTPTPRHLFQVLSSRLPFGQPHRPLGEFTDSDPVGAEDGTAHPVP